VQPTGILCVIPSRLGVGEQFTVKVKVLGPVRPVPCSGSWRTPKPGLAGPFNLNVDRGIQYLDNCLPAWAGALEIDGGGALAGPARLTFDGAEQGVFAGDTRPINVFGGFRWTRPGFHFVRLVEPRSGLEAWSNPVHVTEQPPAERIVWGDPHWQTFLSDAVRCPEELYAFARDEAFLDFGAISDHVEAVTDRQWEYMAAVSNDYNEPGRFATLIGQEWTNHTYGHRNIYYRGEGGPVLRSTDTRYDTLDKLRRAVGGLDVLVIPHHTASAHAGCDWSFGWDSAHEKAVEIHSVWGCSERPAEAGNTLAIRFLGGEAGGRHVIDALRRGYRFGFVGGGDIHDGRPGDELHTLQKDVAGYELLRPQGFTAAFVPELTRGCIYEAIRDRRTYATTASRIYLTVHARAESGRARLAIQAASEDGIREAVCVRNGEDAACCRPDDDPRVVVADQPLGDMGPDEFCYVRVVTGRGAMAWSSPIWGDEIPAQ